MEAKVEMQNPPADDTPAIVTFLNVDEIDLQAQGISEDQAAELRSALATFEDWNAPEINIYNYYDAAKTKLQTR
jgi:hypothetical protein